MAAAGVIDRCDLLIVEPKAFGARMRLLRQRRGMTRAQFAVALGFDEESRVPQSWEQGERTPKTLDLPHIIEVLECTYDELFTDPDPSEIPSQRGRPKKQREE